MESNKAIDLRYWRRKEFVLVQPDGTEIDWWDDMSIRQMVLLDLFRFHWGRRCEISPHPKALGRKLGRNNTSQHNVDRWGEVRASDIFPYKAITRADAQKVVDIATQVGFTGIGIYPDWQMSDGLPAIGVHLDCRTGSDMGQPAKWGGVLDDDGNQVYVRIDDAIKRL